MPWCIDFLPWYNDFMNCHIDFMQWHIDFIPWYIDDDNDNVAYLVAHLMLFNKWDGKSVIPWKEILNDDDFLNKKYTNESIRLRYNNIQKNVYGPRSWKYYENILENANKVNLHFSNFK